MNDGEVRSRLAVFGLTNREQEIVILLLGGHNGVDVQRALDISYNTVKAHVKNIYRKCNVSSRKQLCGLLGE